LLVPGLNGPRAADSKAPGRTLIVDKPRRLAPPVGRPNTVSSEQHTDDLGARHEWMVPRARIVGDDAIVIEQQVVALRHVEGAPRRRVDGVWLRERTPVDPQLAPREAQVFARQADDPLDDATPEFARVDRNHRTPAEAAIGSASDRPHELPVAKAG